MIDCALSVPEPSARGSWVSYDELVRAWDSPRDLRPQAVVVEFSREVDLDLASGERR